MRTVVFVYGTLKRGFLNHPLLERSESLGEARTRSAWPLVIAGEWFVPCLLERPGCGRRVRGELYAVDAPTLAALDELEGVGEPEGYDRRTIEVEREPDGEPLEVEVYFKREPLGEIHGGELEEYDDDRYVGRAGRGRGGRVARRPPLGDTLPVRERILFVCTANVDRSRTAEDLYRDDPRYEVRSAGTAPFSTTPVSRELLRWADRVFVMCEREDAHATQLRMRFPEIATPVIDLDLVDRWHRGDPELVSHLRRRLAPHLGEPQSTGGR